MMKTLRNEAQRQTRLGRLLSKATKSRVHKIVFTVIWYIRGPSFAFTACVQNGDTYCRISVRGQTNWCAEHVLSAERVDEELKAINAACRIEAAALALYRQMCESRALSNALAMTSDPARFRDTPAMHALRTSTHKQTPSTATYASCSACA
eukprot:6174683-Pleurochrysis_carterae.AAC.6